MAEQFLDVWGVLVNDIAGSELIFLALSFITILIFGVMWKFDNLTTIMILAVWIIIISAFINTLLAISLVVIGYFIGQQINRLVTR